MANNTKGNNQRNGKLSLYPLKFEEVVKDLLKVKPEEKQKHIAEEIQKKAGIK